MLVEEHKLSLDDSVTKYFPDPPASKRRLKQMTESKRAPVVGILGVMATLFAAAMTADRLTLSSSPGKILDRCKIIESLNEIDAKSPMGSKSA
jgi:hypothetical protein